MSLGKSTLLKFISSMFYGVSKNKNGKLIPDFDRFKPWSENEFSGRIKYTLDNEKKYEIFREFRKKTPFIYNENKEDITKKSEIKNIKLVEKESLSEKAFIIVIGMVIISSSLLISVCVLKRKKM